MIIKIEADPGAASEAATIRDLHRWLQRDLDVRRYSEMDLAAPEQASGAMGAAEIINIVFSNGIAAANVVVAAYFAWRSARPSSPPLTITANGISIIVHDASPDTIRQLQALLDPAASAEGTSNQAIGGDAEGGQ
ncbi:hypothetical protein ABZ669_21410 [Streptomyces hirsutus]|uniref:effector-associated constant component EACC1 n=1 Tax=Streptomyces hirsutus TaxID=35620 RepID=UPI00340F9387